LVAVAVAVKPLTVTQPQAAAVALPNKPFTLQQTQV
jgi:hypothetical protein